MVANRVKGRKPAKMIVTAVNAPITTLLKRDCGCTVCVENCVMTASPVLAGAGEPLAVSEFPAGNSGFVKRHIERLSVKFNE